MCCTVGVVPHLGRNVFCSCVVAHLGRNVVVHQFFPLSILFFILFEPYFFWYRVMETSFLDWFKVEDLMDHHLSP